MDVFFLFYMLLVGSVQVINLESMQVRVYVSFISLSHV